MYRLTLDQFEATDLKNTGHFLDKQDPALFIKIGDGKEKFTARFIIIIIIKLFMIIIM